MPQQKGMKRAAKVAARSKKLVEKARVASIRRTERKAELALKEAKEQGTKAK
jgi:hypothetical protein